MMVGLLMPAAFRLLPARSVENAFVDASAWPAEVPAPALPLALEAAASGAASSGMTADGIMLLALLRSSAAAAAALWGAPAAAGSDSAKLLPLLPGAWVAGSAADSGGGPGAEAGTAGAAAEVLWAPQAVARVFLRLRLANLAVTAAVSPL